MKTQYRITSAVLALVAAIGLASTASAQKRLPWGALRVGNADGSIPAWNGGLPPDTAPAGFKKDSGSWADPYADDKVLYTVTGKNVDQYASKLTEATVEMLRRYPTYRLDVYSSRRPANYTTFFNDNAQKNAAGRCKTIEGGLALAGCFGGTPFSVPKDGYEAMWNMLLTNKGDSVWTFGQAWYVDAAGNKVMTGQLANRYQNDYFNPKLTAEKFYAEGGPYYMNSTVYTAPARMVGEATMSRKWINPIARPDRSWSYNPGQRRVRLAPDAAYDFPVATSGGVLFFDEIYTFSGRMDRFDFKYIGTKEMLIPYNSYKYFSAKADDLLMKGHPNPDVMRWELHRVHVVEATLKPGARHVLAKRRYYMDEDIPQAGGFDAWDASGKLAKGMIAPAAWAYDKQVVLASGSCYFDLNTGVWYNSSVMGGANGLKISVDEVDSATFYSPEGLMRRTQR